MNTVTTRITAQSLTGEQKRVVRSVLEGSSVFFSGAAGTGKSLVLKKIVGCLPADTTVVTAATGELFFAFFCLVENSRVRDMIKTVSQQLYIARNNKIVMRNNTRATGATQGDCKRDLSLKLTFGIQNLLVK